MELVCLPTELGDLVPANLGKHSSTMENECYGFWWRKSHGIRNVWLLKNDWFSPCFFWPICGAHTETYRTSLLTSRDFFKKYFSAGHENRIVLSVPKGSAGQQILSHLLRAFTPAAPSQKLHQRMPDSIPTRWCPTKLGFKSQPDCRYNPQKTTIIVDIVVYWRIV